MLWIDTFAHWLHLMAAAIWVGGMIFAGFVLAPIARCGMPPAVRVPFFNAAGKRFGWIGRVALVVFLGAYLRMNPF